MMKPNHFLAGTALCLMMSMTLSAKAGEISPGTSGTPVDDGQGRLILAQAGDPNEAAPGADAPAGEDCPPGTETAGDGGCVVLEEEAPQEQPTPEAEGEAPEESPDAVPVEPEAQPADPQPEAPAEEALEDAPAEIAPEIEAQPPEAEPPADDGEAQDAAPDGDAVPTPDEPDEEPPAEQTPDAEQQQPAGEEAPADAGETQAPEGADAEPGAEDAAPAVTECPPGMEQSAAGDCIAAEEEAPGGEEPSAEEAAPAEEMPLEEATPEEAEPEDQPAEAIEAPEDPAAPEEGTETDVEPGTETPLDVEPRPEEAADEEVLPENAAPVLDSQKEEEAAGEEQPAGLEPEDEAGQPDGDAQEEPLQEVEETPVPDDETQVQQDTVDPEQLREEIRAIVEEEGERIELGQTPEDQQVRRRELYERRQDARIVEEYTDNRTIVEINNNVYVESPEYDRFVRADDSVYYERLRNGQVREVIERPNGTRVITVRNRYGDVIRRVRVMPDGHEYVLAYVPESRFDTVLAFEDPAAHLPPLELTIPVSEYILESETVRDPSRYYTFLQQPPVEPVQRLYSLDEVKYSARVRDTMRRIDLDTIEFEFGSARIEESEIVDLEALANAMLEMLEDNPAETFLIEGHTDAVGSELANLALSDRRAEAVARALTDVFGVPPENLVTQGYGEQYLKVNTQDRERENRRVAIRRITPLVTPVASNR